MTASPDNDWPPRQASDFASTQWSLVLRAGQRGNQQAEFALASLCQRYWFPLYAYVRRRVADVHRAQDLTQDFFARLLDKNVLASASPDRGRFRSFLLTSLKNFLANEWDREGARKRGGDLQCLSLDWDSGESRLQVEPAHLQTPEREFERQWALSLLEIVVQRLSAEFVASGKTRHFELLKQTLTGDRSSFDYLAIATEMQISEDAARQAAHRLRKRYRELLREEVAATVESDNEIEDEIGRLFEAFGG